MNRDKFTINDIASVISQEQIVGAAEKVSFKYPRSLSDADEYSIIWIKPTVTGKDRIIRETSAPVIVCDPDVHIPDELKQGKCFIVVDNPRLTFAKIINHISKKEIHWGIHPTAVIDEAAQIDQSVYVGSHCVIGKAKIAAGSILYGNVHIYDDVSIGGNCIIHAGVVLGAEGFGFEKDRDGSWTKFPQIGGIVIGDNVEIGANSCIDRGALVDTIIGNGVKIDNLVQIGHNVRIDENTIICGMSVVGGSTEIGRGCWIAPGCSILNGIKIGDDTFIGLGSVVLQSVPDNTKVFGNPARPVPPK